MSFAPSRLASTSADNTVTMSTNDTVYQGNSYYYSIVYIDSLENISSLKITIYFDSTSININSSYNYVYCSLYDSSINEDNISYSYIFGSDTTNTKTSLFYFYYSIISDATLGNTYFDIVVDEAYDSSLNVVEISGSRKTITIKESKQSQRIYIYGTSSILSKKEQEFDISYYLYNYEIASGNLEITYNQELFEFISLTNGDFLNDKLVDYNSSIKGTVSISFIGTTTSYNSNLFTLKFKTIVNQDTTSKIKLTIKEFYDRDLNPVLCDGYATTVSLSYDSEYDKSLPKMSLSSAFDTTQNKLDILVKLSANSKLGAGDFVITWDKTYFEYVSYTKEFSPTYFNVNEKETTDGKLKFSILSMTDIIDANDVILVSFNVTNPHDETSFPFEITGTGLTDSLTIDIKMNFIDCNQVVSGKCTYGEWTIKEEATCTKDGVEHRVCTVCGKEETRVIAAKGHNFDSEWTVDVKPTCTKEGSKSHHCKDCDEKTDVTIISKLEHKPSSAVVENKVEATCTTDGSYDEVVYCSDCHNEISRIKKTITTTGHSYGDWKVTKEATCTEEGFEHRICSICGDEEIKSISKLNAKQCFVDTVNSFDFVNDDKEVLKSKIDDANSYYQYITDKDSVSDSYSKYLEAVDYYNNKYKDNSKTSNNYNLIYIVIGSIGGVCLLIGIVVFVILKKKKS